jgi:hypothetical protein
VFETTSQIRYTEGMAVRFCSTLGWGVYRISLRVRGQFPRGGHFFGSRRRLHQAEPVGLWVTIRLHYACPSVHVGNSDQDEYILMFDMLMLDLNQTGGSTRG